MKLISRNFFSKNYIPNGIISIPAALLLFLVIEAIDDVEVSAEDTGVMDTDGLISEPILFDDVVDELLLELLDGGAPGLIIGLFFKALISKSLNFTLEVACASVFSG